MGKLFRSVHSENMRLYSNSGALLSVAAVFLIALCVSWIFGAGSGGEGLLPAAVTDKINSSEINIPTEYTVEIPSEEEIQEVITETDISYSDISGSDILETDSETSEAAVETYSFESWQDAYRARYAELVELNTEYDGLIKDNTGAKREYYTVKQQECVREAFIINQCLENDTPIGSSKAWNVVSLTLWLMLLPIAVIASAVISGKTAGEFKSGVIYTLYTLPVTRLKQYFAKLISTALFTVMLGAAAWAGTVFGAMIGCGGLKYEGSYMRVLGEDVSSVSFFSHSVELMICVIASVFILIAFCGAVSTLTRSQGAAMTLTVLLALASMLLGKAVGGMGNMVCGMSIISVLDISAPLRGIPNYASASYIVSWLCAAVYWLVFVICGYLGMRRDPR